jgi:hypothetical protein
MDPFENLIHIAMEVERAARTEVLPGDRRQAIDLSLKVMEAKRACQGASDSPGIGGQLDVVEGAALDVCRVTSDSPRQLMDERIGILHKAWHCLSNIIPRGAVSHRRAPVATTGGESSPPPRKKKPSKIAQAIALRAEHPDMPVNEIAERVDCHAKYLSGNKLFKAAGKAIKEVGRQSLPKGRKSRDGRLEADDN